MKRRIIGLVIIGIWASGYRYIFKEDREDKILSSEALKNHEKKENTAEDIKQTLPSIELIIIGVNPWVGFAPWAVTEEKGFFKDEGLNVRVVSISRRYEKYYSFGKGKIHFCAGDLGDFSVLAASGYPITIVLEDTWDLSSDKVIIKSKFKDLSQLRGKKIACEKDAYADYFSVIKALERYRLAINDAEIIDMTDEEATIAFIKEKVDAIFTHEPYASIAVKEGDGKVTVVRKEINNDPIGLAVQNEILNKSPDTVAKVLRAYFKAVKWCEEHPGEYYEIVNRKMFEGRQSREELERSKSMFKWLKPKEIRKEMREKGPLYQYCQEILDFYYDQGVIDSKPDPNSFINREF
jgi:NitT/TauT family transport system substrate-binding protein